MARRSVSGRPPKVWFIKTERKVAKQYPAYSEVRKARITAGIWYKMPVATRVRLSKKYRG